MTDHEIGVALHELDTAEAPRPEFAEQLLSRLLADLSAPSPVRVKSARLAPRFVAIAAVLLLLMAVGIAAGSYLVLRSQPTSAVGRVTYLDFDGIVTVGDGGGPKTVWACGSCGLITGFGWSRDGTRLAVAVSEFNHPSIPSGIRFIDSTDNSDTFVPSAALDCRRPFDLSWSPDASTLAYACSSRFIYLLRLDGSAPRAIGGDLVGTHSSPSWSADGRRLAFAVRAPDASSSVYVMDSNGGRLRLLVQGGTAPAWSPDGTTIAYRAGCGGIKYISPAGADLTPSPRGVCRAIGIPGLPSWSPDGKQLALGAPPRAGIFEMDRDGGHLHRLTRDTGAGVFGRGRPQWEPGAR